MTNYTNLSRGEFAAIGVKRILKLLKNKGIQATFFIPGHTVEHFPIECGMIKDEGHEIAHHGYLHEPPETLAGPDEERAVIVKGIDVIKKVLNIIPKGYRSPSWALTRHTLSILQEEGFAYDSSLMSRDFEPFFPYLYIDVDSEGKIVKGPISSLIEIPIHWSLDDYPHFEFVRYPTYVIHGLYSINDVFENWVANFEYMIRNLNEGVITYTFHPEVIGRGHTMTLLEKLINYIRNTQIAEFSNVLNVANLFRRKLRDNQ